MIQMSAVYIIIEQSGVKKNPVHRLMNYFSLCQLVGIYFSFTFLTAHMVSKHMSVLHL